MKCAQLYPITFCIGVHQYDIDRTEDGNGFVGRSTDGRVVATAPEPATIVRAIIKTMSWRRA